MRSQAPLLACALLSLVTAAAAAAVATSCIYCQCIVTLVAIIAAVAFIYFSRLKPTTNLLHKDLRRLSNVVRVEEFLQKNYSANHVVSYYAHTTFRDYTLLAAATGSNAMHSRLVPIRRLPYSCGHMRQLLYVIAQLGDAASGGQVLEVGYGKGTNTIYLADAFPSASFTGIDLVREHAAHATEWASSLGLANAAFRVDDASQPSVSGPFDLVFGVESFCHLDSTEKLQGFLRFAREQLRPGGRLVVVDGFRGRAFEQLPEDVQQAMMLAESGFRIRRMASKEVWQSLAEAAGFTLVNSVDLTAEALAFWTVGWRVAHALLVLVPWALHAYFRCGARRAETGANFVSVAMTAYAMALGSAEYGALTFKKK